MAKSNANLHKAKDAKNDEFYTQLTDVSKELSRYEISQNLVEELADVKLVLDQVVFLLACDDEVQEVMKQKIERSFERIGE